MNILFATAQPALPEIAGGMQASVNELALRLSARGHKVTFFCGLMGKGFTGFRARLILKLLRRPAARDKVLGYPVWRAWFPWENMDWVVRRVRPDIIVVFAGKPVRMALAARRTGVPVLMKFQNVEFTDHGGEFESLGAVACVANSQFTADRYRQTYGVAPVVIHPLIDAVKYKTDTTRENVTLINPRALKGVDVAIAAAKLCPDIPFSFVEAWSPTSGERAALAAQLEGVKNVTLHPAATDMRKIYGKCKILLAPSLWEEAYGRVASEAQCSGIPVVASNRGGLPEAVGPGGVLLNPEGSAEEWAAAIQKLWSDPAYYQQLSAAARAYAGRPALNMSSQLDMWEKVISETAAKGGA